MKTKNVVIAFLGGVAAGVMGAACRKKEAPATVQEVLRRVEARRVEDAVRSILRRRAEDAAFLTELERAYDGTR